MFDNMKIVLYSVHMKAINKTNRYTQDVQEVLNTQDVQEVQLVAVGATALEGKGRGLRESGHELIARYVASLDIKPRSRETYRKSLKQFLLFLQEQGIQDPQRSDILAYKAYLQANYTGCTVSTYMAAVRGLFTYLEAERVCPNVARGVKGAKQQADHLKDELTVQQAKRILSLIDRSTLGGLRDYALVNLLIRTGLRTVEAQRANIEDVRQSSGNMLLYVQGKGKDSKDAFVILTESAKAPIDEYLQARGNKADKSAPLFASLSDKNNGERLTTRSISRIVKNALRAAGIDSDRITAHSLRHTAVTFSLLAGATVQEAQLMARHADISTTMRYAHKINRFNNSPESRIDSLLGM
jgi:site-specific recombinase XerD